MAGADSIPPGAPRQKNVLVVEDNDDARAAMVAFLELDGHVVSEASDGTQALEIARTKRPEAALIDIGLPGIDGYELAKRIRAMLGRGVFMGALTGYGEPEDRQRALEAGFDAHLVKPVDPTRLTEVISRGR